MLPRNAVLRLTSDDVPADILPTPEHSLPVAGAGLVAGAGPAAETAGRGNRTPSSPSRLRRRRRVLATVGLAATVVAAAVMLAASPSPTPTPSAAADADTAGAVEPAPTPPSPPPPIPPSSTLGDIVRFAVPAPATITIAAAADSWVQIRTADGTIPFEGLVAAGESAEVPVGVAASIRLGNPAGVLVAADGRLLDHPRPGGEPLTLELG